MYRAHPDWCLHVAGRERTESRNQLVLDLSRPVVQEYVVQSVSGVLRSANITYLKWDFNRPLTEVGNQVLPADRQGEVLHRWVLGTSMCVVHALTLGLSVRLSVRLSGNILTEIQPLTWTPTAGLYRILHEVTTGFPHVLIESCAGGGNRFDMAMLYFTRQIWTSDNTDAVGRTLIQYGSSFAYPASTMASHVSVVPNHQLHRTTPLWTRHVVAMAGLLGYELNLESLASEERDIIRTDILFWKKYVQPLIMDGDLYRLANPFAMENPSTPNVAAWMYVAPDQSSAVIHCVLVSYYEFVVRAASIQPRGLDPQRMYRVRRLRHRSSNVEAEWLLTGQTLMSAGLIVKMERDADAILFHLEAVLE